MSGSPRGSMPPKVLPGYVLVIVAASYSYYVPKR